MKVLDLFEDRYFDEWAKKKGKENRERLALEKSIEKSRRELNKPPKVVKPKREDVLTDLWNKINRAVGNSFPDGDPLDHLSSYLRNHGLTMKDVDAACKKYNHTTFNKMMVDMWDDSAADAIHDAKNMLAHKDHAHTVPEYSPFWRIVDGKVIAEKNPWK